MSIVLINGPFGVGKSTTAQIIASQLPETVLFDPETVGTYLGHALGRDLLGNDYQDLPLWRHLFIDIALRLQEDWQPNVIIPMNLWRYDYFSEIISGIEARGTEVSCFRLTCSPDTLLARILNRPNADADRDWCLAHMESGLAAANDPRFGIEIKTDAVEPHLVADQIATMLKTISRSPDLGSVTTELQL